MPITVCQCQPWLWLWYGKHPISFHQRGSGTLCRRVGPKIVPGENICCLFPESVWAKGSSNMEVCYTSSYVHIFITSSSHLRIFSSLHLHIFTSSHLHIFTSSHLHIFSSSLSRLLSPSLFLSLSLSLSLSLALCHGLSPSFSFLSEGRGQGRRGAILQKLG